MNDHSTTIAELRSIVRDFVTERDWEQFHSPKNLSMSLAIESAEVMEHFQWLTMEASREITADAVKLQAVSEEVADVLCYVLAMANELNLDLSACLRQKMIKNREKYPVAVIRGRFGHDDVRPSSNE